MARDSRVQHGFVHDAPCMLAGQRSATPRASHGVCLSAGSCRSDNVVRPLTTVREEFFETFTARAAYTDSSRDDFEAGKRSLQRMLADFERDVTRSGFRAEDGETGMGVLLRHYEQELKHPIRNAVTGTLPRSLLIQV